MVPTDNGDNNYFACPSSTDYVITFCPSFTPIPTRRKSQVIDPLTNKTKNETLESSKETTTRAKHNSQLKLKVILGVSTAFVVMIIIVVIAVAMRAKNAKRKSDWNGKNIEAVLMKLLPDGSGRDVAVKILKELKGNGEEFINEVASMSRTSHVNIVSLLGFCHEGSKRAIIYEFMLNGSLDKFISENMSTKMEWNALYNIAEGVARGLEYLHNRCVSRIVHFDLKPQNILMDEDFRFRSC
ncbi:unnamed protein product [Arabis nemorensis]|uniref:Protein kinase domain-containing protein n=1 Tax=Arabis nemorensis TaxID=586526 RepID=A0A565CMC9_9BRAS|nr:unnamed protein product [Arabis nemorensis]